MKFNSVIATAALGATTVSAAAAGAAAASKMEHVMEIKVKQWEDARSRGLFGGSFLYPKIKKATPCVKGQAGEYKCNKVNLHGFLSHEDLGSTTKAGNDVWGWTSATGREFGIVGETDGVGFVEVNKDGSLDYIGRLNTSTTATSWRDIKVSFTLVPTFLASWRCIIGVAVSTFTPYRTLTPLLILDTDLDSLGHWQPRLHWRRV